MTKTPVKKESEKDEQSSPSQEVVVVKEELEEITTANLQPESNQTNGPTSADVRAYFYPSTWSSPMRQGCFAGLPPTWYGSGIGPRNMRAMAFHVPISHSHMGNEKGGPRPRVELSSGSSTPQERVPMAEARQGATAPGADDDGENIEGQVQWQKQCAVAARRLTAYADAQKIWERMQTGSAPENKVFYRAIDESIEVAMRGHDPVLTGLSKGAKFALRQWRSVVRNVSRNNGAATVSGLYQSFEDALMKCKEDYPSLDVDEMHR